MTAERAARGSSHTSGMAHTTYHGSSTGPMSMSMSRIQPQEAPLPRGDRLRARLPTSTPSAVMQKTRSSPNPIRTTHPSRWKLVASTIRRRNRDGASHCSCVASLSIPSVGSWRCRYGAAATKHTTAAAPRWVTSARRRSSGGRRATQYTISRMSGRTPVALMRAPTDRETMAGSSLPRTRNASATAIDSATSRSLCPLATESNRTTGFAPKATTANAARDGHTWRAVHPTTRTVPMLATIAITRYAFT
jgi:hypothetical protein